MLKRLSVRRNKLLRKGKSPIILLEMVSRTVEGLLKCNKTMRKRHPSQ